MLMILGVLSLLQMTVLPGSVVLRMLRFESVYSIQRAVYTFCVSLLANYVVNSFLFELHLYRPAAVWTLIAAELLYLVLTGGGVLGFWRIRLDVSQPPEGLTDLCAVLAFAAVFVYCWVALQDFGNVFSLWDDVVSWDRWAVGWVHHNVEGTGLYPQLIPAN